MKEGKKNMTKSKPIETDCDGKGHCESAKANPFNTSGAAKDCILQQAVPNQKPVARARHPKSARGL